MTARLESTAEILRAEIKESYIFSFEMLKPPHGF
jgi:hypothetical protein